MNKVMGHLITFSTYKENYSKFLNKITHVNILKYNHIGLFDEAVYKHST